MNSYPVKLVPLDQYEQLIQQRDTLLAAVNAQDAYERHLGHCRYCNVGVNCEEANRLFGEAQEKRKAAIAKAEGTADDPS